MRATLRRFNLSIGYCEVVTDNDILISFPPPEGIKCRLGDVYQIDLDSLDRKQQIQNVSTGQTFSLTIRSGSVHDLRLPCKHGTSRFPSKERLKGD
jgi:hypothetical protein